MPPGDEWIGDGSNDDSMDFDDRDSQWVDNALVTYVVWKRDWIKFNLYLMNFLVT